MSNRSDEIGYSTLKAHDSTLDGISFKAADPKGLADALRGAKDKWDEKVLTSMEEDPDHWPLRGSFGKTVGTGWREAWHGEPYVHPTVPSAPGMIDNVMSARFGNAGSPVRFTALHCAVDEIGGQCNIHIDESGFVLRGAWGVSLTPDLYDHIVNELVWKTEIRDWLAGKTSNDTAKYVIREVVRRISFNFPNAANGYAGLHGRIRSMRRPGVLGDAAVETLKLLRPLGVTFDVYENDRLKVQVTGAIVDRDSSLTITLGGKW